MPNARGAGAAGGGDGVGAGSGRTAGGAAISTKHANFIVNQDHARAADIEALIDCAQAAVKEKFGIELEREVRIIGEHA